MPESNRYHLAAAPIWRALMHLCIPMIAGFSVGTVYNIINAGFIGSLHSTPMLAALTFAMPVFALIMAVGGVFGVGGGTYISRLLGSLEDTGADATHTGERIKQVSSFTLWAALAAGAVIGVIGVTFATPIATAAADRLLARIQGQTPLAAEIVLPLTLIPRGSGEVGPCSQS